MVRSNDTFNLLFMRQNKKEEIIVFIFYIQSRIEYVQASLFLLHIASHMPTLYAFIAHTAAVWSM